MTQGTGLLDKIERVGNALPDPTTLFLIGALLVMVLSQLAASLDWSVEKTVSRPLRQPVLDASGSPVLDPETGEEITTAVLDPRDRRAAEGAGQGAGGGAGAPLLRWPLLGGLQHGGQLQELPAPGHRPGRHARHRPRRPHRVHRGTAQGHAAGRPSRPADAHRLSGRRGLLGGTGCGLRGASSARGGPLPGCRTVASGGPRSRLRRRLRRLRRQPDDHQPRHHPGRASPRPAHRSSTPATPWM